MSWFVFFYSEFNVRMPIIRIPIKPIKMLARTRAIGEPMTTP